MEVLPVLIPLALGMSGLAVAAFIWAVKQGQYEDVDRPPWEVLIDDLEEDSDRR